MSEIGSVGPRARILVLSVWVGVLFLGSMAMALCLHWWKEVGR